MGTGSALRDAVGVGTAGILCNETRGGGHPVDRLGGLQDTVLTWHSEHTLPHTVEVGPSMLWAPKECVVRGEQLP